MCSDNSDTFANNVNETVVELGENDDLLTLKEGSQANTSQLGIGIPPALINDYITEEVPDGEVDEGVSKIRSVNEMAEEDQNGNDENQNDENEIISENEREEDTDCACLEQLGIPHVEVEENDNIVDIANLELEMDRRYGARSSRYDLQPRKARDYEHLYNTIDEFCMTQYKLKKGLEIFGTEGLRAGEEELKQLNDCNVIMLIDGNCWLLRKNSKPFLTLCF
jgi:hypothetical protein